MYSKKLWTMRQYAGFGDARTSNERYRYLMSQGITGLSIAFDLPTQMGYDSDHALAQGEVGRAGVAISSLDDMCVVLDQIPLGDVSTSMTINSTAAILLAFYLVVAEKQGVSPKKLRGTVQNDVLKEYIARGTYIFPPKASLKITTDIVEYCRSHVPDWNTISISGYHIREAGSTAVQEVAFTVANGLCYIAAALDRGLGLDDFAPRLSFFFNVHNDFCEEISKFRAARRLWAKLMRERFSPKDPKSLLMRFHAQTAGSTLIAQDTGTNVVRVTLQCMAAVLGGAQSIHTNSKDEALGLPTVESATLALRTQQVIAHESGVAGIVDPMGGSYSIEEITDRIEKEARALVESIEKKGGVIQCIQDHFQQDAIQSSSYQYQTEIEKKQRIIVGLNQFTDGAKTETPVLKIDSRVERDQVARLTAFKQSRNAESVRQALALVQQAAREDSNVMPLILSAVKSHATLGEITDTLIQVFGRFS